MRSVHAIGSFIMMASSCIFAIGGVAAAIHGDLWQGGLYALMAVGITGYAALLAHLADAGTNRLRKFVGSHTVDPKPPVDPYQYEKVIARYRTAHRRPTRIFGHWRLGYQK